MTDIRRRCVFYVSGFDPKGAAHYHALYKEQAARGALAGGLTIEVGPRKRLPNGNSAWTLATLDGEVPVETHYEFMRWDDVVRAHWPRSQWRLWIDVFRTTFINVRHGSLWKMFKLSWPPAVALFFPFLLLCAVLLGVPGLGWAAARLALHLTGSVPVAAAAGISAALLTAWTGLRLEARFSMYWMMRSYAFTARQAFGRTPDLESRLDEQAATLARRIRTGGDDEILVVGHSSGAIMAAAIVARALAEDPLATRMTVLSLLTLGQWIPLLGLLPPATRFRAELSRLAKAPNLDWIDFSAPPDGCCFALADPIAGSGVVLAQVAADRPKLLSPRFAEMFDRQEYACLRRDKFRMHFQYLMAAPKPAEYDYFRITAGKLTLKARFAHAPSVTDFGRLRPLRPAPSLARPVP
jgi:pimeloyl-ACP methyl ester carboxylesterase